MTIHAGTDTYGRVKAVDGLPVVTNFFMFQGVPVYPVQSFYYFGIKSHDGASVPFIFSFQSDTIDGIPLARLDKMSVIVAYLRGLFGAMIMLGVPVLFIIGVMRVSGDFKPDDLAKVFFNVSLASFVLGVIGGGLTYFFSKPSSREIAIRRCCGEVLNIPLDPAFLYREVSKDIEEYAEAFSEPKKNEIRTQHLLRLVVARAKIAQGIDIRFNESKTDELIALCRRG